VSKNYLKKQNKKQIKSIKEKKQLPKIDNWIERLNSHNDKRIIIKIFSSGENCSINESLKQLI